MILGLIKKMTAIHKATVKNLDTELALYRRRLQHENLVHKVFTRTLENRRAMATMRQHHAQRQAANEHAALVEASLRMSPALQIFYHDRIAQLAKEKLGV